MPGELSYRAKELVSRLGLQPHPEGGFFRETYRCNEAISREALPSRYSGPRSMSTAIYYLLTPGNPSRLHRVASDEIFHFYLGDPVTMLQLHADGTGRTITLGHDVAAGQRLQVLVPAGTWQGCILCDGGSYALLGCTVAPGFDFDDFELADRGRLLREYPAWAEMIQRLTQQAGDAR